MTEIIRLAGQVTTQSRSDNEVQSHRMQTVFQSPRVRLEKVHLNKSNAIK